MILGIQSQAKLILTSTNLGQLWNETSSNPSSTPGRAFQLTLLEALINKPPDYIPSQESKDEYLHQFDLRYGHFSTRLIRIWDDSDWIGLGVIDYHNIGKNSGLNTVQLELAKKEVRMLLEVLHCPPESFAAGENLDETDHLPISAQSETLALLKSLIVLSTILVQSVSPVGAAKVIDAIDTQMRASPEVMRLRTPPKVLRSRTLGDAGNNEEEVRPAILFRRLLRHVTVWSTIGKIAGIQRAAELHLRSRIARWDAAKGSMLAATIIEPQKFFDWFILKPEEPIFIFDIGATEAGRARGAVVYAIIEFLITFGFRLMTPTIELGKSGLYARVARLPLTEVIEKQISIEEIATRLFKPDFLNR